MARLRVDQLERALKQSITPIYLITGDEDLLVQESCDLIRRHALSQGYNERELYHTDSGFEWDTLTNSANSMSLFSDKKIIEIRIHNGKPGDQGSKALLEYCSSASEDNLLLLVSPKIDKRSQNSKWFKAIESQGSIVAVWPVTAQQLPSWLAARLKAAGLSADRQAIEILSAKVEGNLLAAVQEIEKLKLVTDKPFIDAQTMADAVTDSARYDVFNLVDKCLAGDSRAAVDCLHGLRSEGSEPTLILWAIAREIRTLTTIKECVKNGKNFDFSAKQMGVWDNRKPIVKGALQRLTLADLHLLIRRSGDADKMIKGMLKGDAWSCMLDIVLSVTGIQTIQPRKRS